MIRINKGTRVPRKLTKDGQESIRHTCAQYDSDPEAFSSGTSKLPSPKPAIYGHPSVKKELLDCQNQKCCFCEVKFAGDYGDVEHFRPKGCVIDIKTKQKQYPGYYWLAYDWDNLFVCKEILNRSFKRNYFPLSDNSPRAKSHHDNIADETPLLVDPAKDDPRDHIRFHEDEAIAHRNSIKGRITIDLINLNHEHIAEERRYHLALVREHRDWLIKLETLPNKDDSNIREIIRDIRTRLDSWTKSDAQFSSMTIDYLSANPLP